MPRTVTITTAPTVEPITLLEAKEFMRVDNDDENPLIESLISVAREKIESDTKRAIAAQTLRYNLDSFPWDSRVISIPRPPLVAVSSITYIDEDGVTQTWAASNYVVDSSSEPGRVQLAENSEWPETQSGRINAVAINYTAGWSSPPERVKMLAKLWVSHFFENREPVNIGNIVNEIPLALKSLTRSLSVGEYL